MGTTNEGGKVGARRDVNIPRAAVIGVALQRARRLASLNVNGMTPNLLSPARPKKNESRQFRPEGRSAGGPAGMAIRSP